MCVGSGSIPGISQTINHNHMEVITFSPDMDLSSKEAGDVFRLKLYGIEYDVKVVGDDEDPLMFCKDCIFFNNSERCSLSESQDWCLKKQVVYCKIRAGVISAVKDKLPGKDHKKMIFEIRNDGRNEYGRYNNCGGKI